jgi:phosphopantothenoylcysteine decarboxylase/phosphopantothenate--cysteine ligase
LAGRRVLLGVTGGIAAYKSAILARLLVAAGAEVTAVLTEAATRFVGADTFSGLTGREAFTSLWQRPGEVLHVRLAHQADIAVVAPATANVMAKLAHGLADDLLTSTLLEYRGPLVVAPAMHHGMWWSDATQANVAMLGRRGVRFVGPAEGALAHGDEGMGRMAEAEEIVAGIEAALADRPGHDLAGKVVLVTAGPTREPIDPVRYLGNRSSGKMGIEIARQAAARGASVTLILGPTDVTAMGPVGQVVDVERADQMHEEVLLRAPGADAIVMAAAVADFRPKASSDVKLKKDQGVPELVLEPTPDILAELGDAKPAGQVLVGFAAETQDVEAAGREKLARKRLDLLVANLVGREGTGFGSDTNEAAIVSAAGDDVPLRTWTKRELAGALCDRIAALLNA